MPVISPLTHAMAAAIVEAHEIDSAMENEEEAELLEENNPELFAAYKALLLIAGRRA